MKLLELEFAAIGPYPKVQRVDFRGLEGITLVCGSTGAGKTFIFDAVTFALYGETSGGDRQPGTMRCTYADPSDESYVRLRFEHNGEMYEIERRPEQDRLKQRGSGMTHQAEKVEMFLPDGRHLTKQKAVTDEVIGITGLTVEQWGQVVMLAQGKFRAFIDAKSADRGKILESIFGIGIYSRMQEAIAELSKDAEDNLNSASTELAGFAKGLVLEDIPEADEFRAIFDDPRTAISKGPRIRELMDAISAHEGLLAGAAEEEYKKADERAKDADKAYNEAKALHEAFDAVSKEKVVYDSMLGSKPSYDERKAVNDKAKAILMKVLPAEKSLAEANKSLTDAKGAAAEAENQLSKCKEAVQNAKAAQEAAVARTGEMEDLKAESVKLTALLPKYDDADAKRKELSAAEAELMRKAAEVEQKETAHRTLEGKIREYRAFLTKTEESQANLERARGEDHKLGERIIAALNTVTSLNAYRTAKAELSKAEEESARVSGEWQRLDEDLSAKRRAFVLGQSGIIAGSLEEGKPCPVCGSVSHPSPAVRVEGCPTQEEIDSLNGKWKELQSESDAAKKTASQRTTSAATARQSFMANAEKAGIEADPDSDAVDSVISEAKRGLSEQRKALGEEIRTLEGECARRKEINEEFGNKDPTEESQRELDALRAEQTELSTKVSTLRAEYVTISKDLTFGSRNDLQKHIDGLNDKAKSIERLIESANKIKAEAESALSAADATLKSAEQTVASGTALAERREKDFLEAVRGQGFPSVEEYRKGVRTEEQVNKEEAELERFYNGLLTQEGKYNKALEAIEGKTDPENLEELLFARDELANAREERNNEWGQIKGRKDGNDARMNDIRRKLDVISKTMSQLLEIKELSDVATGRTRDMNGMHMSFTDYVRSKYFDSILSRAEARLLHMTGGRYVLRRSKDVSSGANSHLLELEVVDNDSPDARPRPVSSLSGGESFKAALALALGFSDAIQEKAAGQRIDALFIDEGFGTLDEDESLDQAIDILEDLSGGKKTVCIISHVPKLRERIPRQIVVDYENGRGSRMSVVRD